MNPAYTIVNLTSIVEILSITLSVIALAITVIGFFASLKFYRDGVQLQDNANKALIQLGEKTHHIQSQVGDMFNKTLDAAIGHQSKISENFEHINEQLEKTANSIVDKATKQIGIAGEQERVRLFEIVNKQLEPLRKKIDATRESTEELTPYKIRLRDAVIINTILYSHNNLLKERELPEFAKKVSINEDVCRKDIAMLIEKGLITAFLGDSNKYYSVTSKAIEILNKIYKNL